VVGGSFDTPTDLEAWDFYVGAGSSVTWDAMDAIGSSTSGSMRIEVDPTDGGNAVVPLQCYRVAGGASYDYGAYVYQPSSSPLGEAFVRVQWFRDSSCLDFIRSTNTGINPTLDDWVQLSEIGAVAPAGAESAEFILTTFEDPAQLENRVAFWDEATFVPEPSLTASGLVAVLTLQVCRRVRVAAQERARKDAT